ncbi:MAG: helix-turn-helix transcriptional regulator [Dermatophilaceae bacterium]
MNRVRVRRRRDGLTQQQLADHVGVSRQTIVAIEHGDYAPSVVLALRIARVLDTTVEDLYGEVADSGGPQRGGARDDDRRRDTDDSRPTTRPNSR